MDKKDIDNLIQEGDFNGQPFLNKIIETHISWVIFTEDFAFKIKKPLSFSFLDFTTLDQRKFFCHQEVKLNSRLSDIYLDVVYISRQTGNLSITTSEKNIVDYAVRMKKMDEGCKMDVLLTQDKVGKNEIDQLAKRIALFHHSAPIIQKKWNVDDAKKTFNDLLKVNPWVHKHLGEEYSALIKQAIEFSNSFLSNHEDNITSRIKKGFMRDCHGDLHSKNIFLTPDPVIFDCIEFNEAFRQIDVLNDVAFFCMDLEDHNKWDLSKIFMETYLQHFNSIETGADLDLFNYFKIYRANVRAKVGALAGQQISDGDSLKKVLNEVSGYLDLIGGYLKNLNNF